MTNPTSPPPAAMERARQAIDSCSADWSDAEHIIASALTEERTKALEEAAERVDRLADDERAIFEGKDQHPFERSTIAIRYHIAFEHAAKAIRAISRGEEGTT